MARGAWVVEKSWVFASLEAGELVPEEKHETARWPGAGLARKNRLNRGECVRVTHVCDREPVLNGTHACSRHRCAGPQLLRAHTVYVHHDVEQGQDTVEKIVVAAGGTITKSYSRCTVCIASKDYKVRAARAHGAAGCPERDRPGWRQETELVARRPEDSAPIVTSKWLFDSLSKFEVQDTAAYTRQK